MRTRVTANVFPAENKRREFFWLLSSFVGILLIVYMVLIQSAIYNVVVEKKLSKEFRTMQSEMLVLEEDFLEKSKDFGIESISDYGLVSLGKNDVHYVKAEIGSGLTLNVDGL